MKIFDPKTLRNAFGSFMTGVTVVTTMTKDGTPVGFTANSFTSVSLTPPLLLVCPAKSLSTFNAFANCEHFAVNILSEEQKDISNIFAGSKGDRFSQVDWHTDEYGNLIIDGALTHFSCKTDRNLDAGDHHILVGEVLDFAMREGYGLGYAVGGYFSLGLERQAAEISSQQQVKVGAIIEHNGKVLLSQDTDKTTLPTTTTDSKHNAVSAVEQLLADSGINAQLGAVFSIYEDAKNYTNYIFYRATATSEDGKDLGKFTNIHALTEKNFATAAMATMMHRYAEENQHGNYRVYIGNDESGDIH